MFYNMISRSNIKVFDYIYLTDVNNNEENLTEFINKFLDNKNDEYIKFVQDNEDKLVKPDLLITQTLSGYGIVTNNFPKMNNTGLKQYYDYKLEQFKDIMENDIAYDFDNISSDLNLSGIALKRVVDYLIDNKTIKCNGEYATKNILGTYDFDFSALEISYKEKKKDASTIENQVTININGNKNKFSKNDFSNNKRELEKESILDKLLNFFTKIFKSKK